MTQLLEQGVRISREILDEGPDLALSPFGHRLKQSCLSGESVPPGNPLARLFYCIEFAGQQEDTCTPPPEAFVARRRYAEWTAENCQRGVLAALELAHGVSKLP